MRIAGWFAIALLLFSNAALAEDKKEPLAVFSVGPAGEWSLTDRAFSKGPSVAVEFTLIKEWLEVEIGASKLFRPGHSEWETEAIFKKPFDLSETAEYMIGLGPVWTVAKGEPSKVGVVFAADFMFWTTPEKKFGWFIEPSYSILQGGEKSLGVSVGLLFGVHER
jgi:hypothetical protein